MRGGWARIIGGACALGASVACVPLTDHGPVDPGDTDVRTGVFPTVDGLSFETNVRGGPETRSFQIVNRAGRAVTVWNYTRVAGSPEFTVSGVLPFDDLEDGGVLDVPVTFTPAIEGHEQATITVHTDVGSFDVRLEGHGRAPLLQAELVSAPDVVVGCVGTGALRVGNPGSDTLHLTRARLVAGAAEFTVGAMPAEVASGVQIDVPVTFAPGSEGPRQGFLELVSDVPGAPVTIVPLAGTGAPVPWQTTRSHYATGDGLQILVVGDDLGAPAVVPGFVDRVTSLLDGLDARGVAWRLTAISAADACPGFVNAYATPGDRPEDVAQWIAQSLEDGVGGTFATQPLTAARTALEDDSGCLRGFLRSGDPTVVLVLTETDDASPGGWASELARMTEVTSGLSVDVVAPSCQVSLPVLDALVAATSGRVHDRCETPWVRVVDAIAGDAAAREGGPLDVRLPEAAVADRVRLTVDSLPAAYTIDATGTRVSPAIVPPVGAALEVDWLPAGVCSSPD